MLRLLAFGERVGLIAFVNLVVDQRVRVEGATNIFGRVEQILVKGPFKVAAVNKPDDKRKGFLRKKDGCQTIFLNSSAGANAAGDRELPGS